MPGTAHCNPRTCSIRSHSLAVIIHAWEHGWSVALTSLNSEDGYLSVDPMHGIAVIYECNNSLLCTYVFLLALVVISVCALLVFTELCNFTTTCAFVKTHHFLIPAFLWCCLCSSCAAVLYSCVCFVDGAQVNAHHLVLCANLLLLFDPDLVCLWCCLSLVS